MKNSETTLVIELLKIFINTNKCIFTFENKIILVKLNIISNGSRLPAQTHWQFWKTVKKLPD